MRPPAPLLVVGAMPEELAPLLEPSLGRAMGRRRAVNARLAGVACRVLACGPGPVNAAMAVAAAVARRRPAGILLLGCGGAFPGSGLEVGEVAVATEEIDAHLGLEPARPGDLPEAFPLPVLPGGPGGRPGRYTLHAEWAARAGLVGAKAAGPFLTVSTVTTTRATAETRGRLGVLVENMEGAAVAHVAAFHGLPMVEIRGVSNMVGPRRRGEWDIPRACARAAEVAWEFLAGLAEVGHD